MLTIKDLSKTYPDGTQALRNISLDIEPGVFGLLGPNGAGKSSLMRTLATLQLPTEGHIKLGELDVLAEPAGARAVIGYLPQDFGLHPQATALSLLDHFAVLKGVGDRHHRREVVEHLLASVNLWKVRKKRLQSFSGGMRQRFGIAQALLGKPSLVIVDEPTAGLDPTERHRVLDLLAEAGDQAVVLLSTHIVADVADLCPRMAVLVGGSVRLVASPEEAIENVRGRVWQIPLPSMLEVSLSVPLISTRRTGGQAVGVAISDDAPSLSSSQKQATLEDVYFSIIAESTLHAEAEQ